MKISVSIKPKSDSERDHLAKAAPELFKNHTLPIRELLSNHFLLNVNCVRPEEFHEQYAKLDDEDHAGLDNLANTFTSIPTFVGLMRHAASNWALAKFSEKGFIGSAKIKESGPDPTSRMEFALPAGLQAITADELRALLGDRQAISPDALAKLIQEAKAYEETLQPMGWRVVVIYVRNDDGSIHTLLLRDNGELINRLRYFLPSRQAALVYFFSIDVDPNDAQKAKAAITAPSKYRTTVRIVDAVHRFEEDPTRIIDLIREYVDANVPGEGRELANAILDFIALIPPEHVTLILDFLQLMLDIVGMFPGAGEPVDLVNTSVAVARKQYLDAAAGVVAMAPFAGAVPGVGKALWRIGRIIKLADALPAGLRNILLDLVSGLKDELMSIASKKLSDIVSGLKRRINEATDRLRIFAKKGDDAPLPGRSGKQNTPFPPSKGDATPVEAPPSKPPSKPDSEGEPPSKKPQQSENKSPDTMPIAGELVRGNKDLGDLIKKVAISDGNASAKAAALLQGAEKIANITFKRIADIPGAEAVFVGESARIGKTPLLVVLKDGRIFKGLAEYGLVNDPSGMTKGFRIMLSKMVEVK